MNDIKGHFTAIYKTNYWNSPESRSGGGSEMKATIEIREWLLQMVEKYSIQSMVDCACGDFNWMKAVEFPEVFSYTGIDVVDEMVHSNMEKYGKRGRIFLTRDMTKDIIPKADLLFCKDLFLHLSFEHISQVLSNFKASKSKYLIVSNGIGMEVNEDKETGGSWRVVNLQKEPFSLNPPLEIFDIGFTQMTLHSIENL
jgi:hypothetical protein